VKTGRFFVTAVVFLSMALAVACDADRRSREAAGRQQHETNAQLAKEGNEKLGQAQVLERSLEADYKLTINTNPKVTNAQVKATIEKFPWKSLHLIARRDIQGKIARYLQLMNRVIEIDSKRLITVDFRERVLAGRDSAEVIQKTIEKFEKANGESYDFKDETPAPSRRAESAVGPESKG
jgi:hypothetical protein